MPLTPDMRRSIDQIRDYLYGGGYPDPVSNAEQLSFLFFFYLLEGIDQENQLRAKVMKRPYTSVFDGEWTLRNPLNATNAKKKTISCERLRWSVWAKGMTGEALVRFVRDEVFAFVNDVGEAAAHNFMRGARLSIDEPTVLSQVVTLVDGLRLDQADADTKGDLFEHVLRHIRQAGELGQFRTPRHIIRAIVQMVDPRIGETIYDPAAGTAGFLVAAYNHIRLANSSPKLVEELELDGKKVLRGLGDRLSGAQNTALQNTTFFGNDVDPKMVRLATMNLTLRGLPNVPILLRNVLTTTLDNERKAELGQPPNGFNVILANPPFSGRIDKDRIVDDVKVGSSTATELLFLSYMMQNLREKGRCAIIVPDGVVRGTSSAHQELRRRLLSDFRVEAVIGLPHAAFKPYASVATYILIFSRNAPASRIWMYQVSHDGFSPDSLRQPIENDDLPDLIKQWKSRSLEAYQFQTGKHGWVDVASIREEGTVLVPKLFLNPRGKSHKYPTVKIGDICTVTKGLSSASKTAAGRYTLVTTAKELKTAAHFDFSGDAVCIPLVSSTGHGHASIKRLHFVSGPFAAAQIVAVVQKRESAQIDMRYVFRYLSVFKDDLLVPLMHGAANVSLTKEKIEGVEIPLPPTLAEQSELVEDLEEIDRKIVELKAQIAALETDFSDELVVFQSNFGASVP